MGGVIPSSPTPLRVLAVHHDPALLRLIRESLEGLAGCAVDTSGAALHAYDRLVQREYDLLILDLHLPVLSGEMLYDLASRAWPHCHRDSITAPPVIWAGVPADAQRHDTLTREARVRGLLLAPFSIQKLLDLVRPRVS